MLTLVVPMLMAACSGDAQSVTPAAGAFTPATDRPTLLYFYAADCELCPQMQPIVDQIRAQYQDRVMFVYLDAAQAGDVMAQYRSDRLPRLCAAAQRWQRGVVVPRLAHAADVCG